jgi:hypothetical protein
MYRVEWARQRNKRFRPWLNRIDLGDLNRTKPVDTDASRNFQNRFVA